MPILVLGPEKRRGFDGEDSAWTEGLGEMAGKKQIELLEVWNLTMKTKGFDGGHDRGLMSRHEVSLVEAMMIINWLSMLETS